MNLRRFPLAPTMLVAVGLGYPGVAAAICTPGASWLSVPEDCATIDEAVAAVGVDGTIDIASGTYTFGTGGLNVGAHGMTLQARSTGGVTFDGGGVRPLVKDQANAGSVVFEGIRFVNGATSKGNTGGAVTLSNAAASFVDCEFTGNRSTNATTGGGAISLVAGARALIVRSSFSNNSAINNGGAIYGAGNNGAVSLSIQGSSFTGNSTAAAGFTDTAAGGAIYLRNGELAISDTSFSGNLAGWVGGAVYAWGDWQGTTPSCAYSSAPSASVTIARTVFTGNRADDAAAPRAAVEPTFGGAVHLERCVRATISESRFTMNEAGWGGAIVSDHAALSLDQSSLRLNRARTYGSHLPVGGAIWAYSGGSGTPNGWLTVDHTLFEGGVSGNASARNAQLGGCIYAAGDPSKARLPVDVSSSSFFRCNVGWLQSSSNFVRGGAIFTSDTALLIRDSLFIRNHADGGASGGYGRGAGIALGFDSTGTFSGEVVVADSTSDVPPAFAAYLDVSVETSTTSGLVEEWTEQPPAKAGILVAAPSLVQTVGPAAGAAVLAWAWRGSAATLDGAGLPGSPKNGISEVDGGAHELVVSGLGGCGLCSAQVGVLLLRDGFEAGLAAWTVAAP